MSPAIKSEILRYMSYGWDDAMITGLIMYRYEQRVLRHVLLILRIEKKLKIHK